MSDADAKQRRCCADRGYPIDESASTCSAPLVDLERSAMRQSVIREPETAEIQTALSRPAGHDVEPKRHLAAPRTGQRRKLDVCKCELIGGIETCRACSHVPSRLPTTSVRTHGDRCSPAATPFSPSRGKFLPSIVSTTDE